jgi:hypothetical protein
MFTRPRKLFLLPGSTRGSRVVFGGRAEKSFQNFPSFCLTPFFYIVERRRNMKKKNINGSAAAKGHPVPVRFDVPEEKFLDDLAASTGLKKAEIIRRAGRYAFPKFLNREINILDVVPEVEVPA